MVITYKAKFSKKGTYKNTAVATSDNTDPVKAKNTVKVTKSGVSPKNVTPKNVIKTITKGTKDVKNRRCCLLSSLSSSGSWLLVT